MFQKMTGWILASALLVSLSACTRTAPSFVPFDSDKISSSEETLRDEGSEAESVLVLDGRRYSFSGDGEAVTSEDDVLRVKKAGVFRMTGTLSEGGICIDVGHGATVRLILDGVSLSSSRRPCLTVRSAASMILETVADSVNCFFSTADAVIDADGEVVLCGAGSLSLSGASCALRSSDRIVVQGGVWTVGAKQYGLLARNCLEMSGGRLSVHASEVGLATEEDETFGGGIRISGGNVSVLASDAALSARFGMFFSGGCADLRAPTLYRCGVRSEAVDSVGKIEFLGGSFPTAAS